MTLKVIGTLTHEDYPVIRLMLESALAGVNKLKVKMLFDGQQLQGWSLRAAWDDFKLGLTISVMSCCVV